MDHQTEHHNQVLVAGEGHDTAHVDVHAEVEVDDELLIEEISIDGMCGVY